MIKATFILLVTFLFFNSFVFADELSELRMKVENRDASAQFDLGFMFANGEGVTQDYKQAVYWYTKSAEQGDAGAQYNLALMFVNGEGVTQDYKQAVDWYRKAAEQGYAGAQNNLGLMFFEGKGVTQDYVQAHKWWNISAFEDFLAAASGGADARKNRDLVENKMTKEQVSEAQRLAREWMEAYKK